MKTYQNRFGSLSVIPVTEFMPVGKIKKEHPQAMANMFDMDTAEKIALITGNRQVQICVCYPLDGMAYLVLHDTPNTAAICRVQLDAFTCEDAPQTTIERLNRMDAVLH